MPAIPVLPHSLVPGHLAWPEGELLSELAAAVQLSNGERAAVNRQAAALVQSMRAHAGTGITQFLHEYGLSTAEGVALLSLAEALLRIPDPHTADELIRDKLAAGDWRAHRGHADSALVNVATLGLSLAQAVLRADSAIGKLLALGGEPVLRRAVQGAMQMMANQFVMGADIENAVRRAENAPHRWRYSFDMLGEGARTAADAERYFTRYRQAIRFLGATGRDVLPGRGGISVKLSALHPRYEPAHYRRTFAALSERLFELCREAMAAQIPLTVDAEEAERLDFSLALFKAVVEDPALREWDGLGLAVQAYQKRAPAVLAWVAELADRRAPVHVRLVKGAYWDTEIKRAQERGLAGYPVYTRKAATDVAFLACAKQLLACKSVRPAFATHNALTVATLLEWAGARRDFEFQRLHGMGDGLYEPLLAQGYDCRIYAPVGTHEDLLAYLVRRLLENGANTSFVRQLSEKEAEVLADPVAELARVGFKPHPGIPAPRDLYAPERSNSHGPDLSDSAVVAKLIGDVRNALAEPQRAVSLINAHVATAQVVPILDPADRRRQVGSVIQTQPQQMDAAVRTAVLAHASWVATGVEQRAQCLERAAALLEDDVASFMALAMSEAGKTLADALAEVREAADYCRYYAAQARRQFQPTELPGPTGERNTLMLVGRGPFVCISPWNFPLAIFIGQVTAALVSGCSVLAKPAPQTPLMAEHATRLLHRAGIPEEVLQLLPGGGDIGEALVGHPDIRGVAFTGSTSTARRITQVLANKSGPLLPFIAETGGQNAMIVDSSALAEQVVNDVLVSAFQSAGQRCSALRVLYLQEEIAPRVLEMLKGALGERVLGDPLQIDTDIGPVIDTEAQQKLLRYLHAHASRIIYQLPLRHDLQHGTFVPPTLLGMDSAEQIIGEVFGPVLHVLTWKARQLDEVLAAINRSGYGLTLGVHSRIGRTVEYIRAGARVGNLYVNRSMIGAVVGVQPFGGEGLSGTGPKAGGPHYLRAFAIERTVSIDTTSAGGNAALMSLRESS